MNPTTLVWHSIDPRQNRARWYSISVSTDLWGNPALIRRWGRINHSCQERIEWPDSLAALDKAIQRTHLNRQRHHYTLVASERSLIQ